MDNLVCSSLRQIRKPAKLKTRTSEKKPRWSSPSSSVIDNSPVKVVYISNPMRVKATASEFRALVQELTGQDSELPDDPAKFTFSSSPKLEAAGQPSSSSSSSHRAVPATGAGGADKPDNNPNVEEEEEGAAPALCPEELYLDRLPAMGGEAFNYEDDYADGVFIPEMLDNFVGLCPSSLLYGS